MPNTSQGEHEELLGPLGHRAVVRPLATVGTSRGMRPLLPALLVASLLLSPALAVGQPVRGTCTSCGEDRVNCGMCIANGAACFD